MDLPQKVRLVEMGPRDGLQNEPGAIDIATRVALVERLAAAGVRHIEAGAFVSPKAVPQMAASDEVFAGLARREGVRYGALTPNLKGFERALAAGVDEVAVFTSATESFSQKNINCSIAESLARFEPVLEAAAGRGVPVRAYLSCAVGCPYEGNVGPQAVRSIAASLYGMGCYEISLSDTTGVGTPGAMKRMIEAVAAEVPVNALAVHCHDTYGQALANIYASLELGIAVVDASVAGLGGCPYAPGASGNVASEDVVYMLDGLGIETGIDLDALAAAGDFISTALGRATASRAGRAMAAKACLAAPATGTA